MSVVNWDIGVGVDWIGIHVIHVHHSLIDSISIGIDCVTIIVSVVCVHFFIQFFLIINSETQY